MKKNCYHNIAIYCFILLFKSQELRLKYRVQRIGKTHVISNFSFMNTGIDNFIDPLADYAPAAADARTATNAAAAVTCNSSCYSSVIDNSSSSQPPQLLPLSPTSLSLQQQQLLQQSPIALLSQPPPPLPQVQA